MSIKVGQIGKGSFHKKNDLPDILNGSFGSKLLSKLKKIDEVELSWVLGSKDKYWE